MTLNRRLTTGDYARMLSEIRAQLPPGYSPFDDYWTAPYDCDCNADVLDHAMCPESLMVAGERYGGHPRQPRESRFRRSGRAHPRLRRAGRSA